MSTLQQNIALELYTHLPRQASNEAGSTNLPGKVFFDHDGHGTPTPTGWLHGDDAQLVLDRNDISLLNASDTAARCDSSTDHPATGPMK